MLYTKLNAIILCKTIFNIFLLINKYKFIVLENLNYPDCVFFFLSEISVSSISVSAAVKFNNPCDVWAIRALMLNAHSDVQPQVFIA